MAHTSPSRRGTSTIRCPERAPSEAPSRKPHRHTPTATRVRGAHTLGRASARCSGTGGNSRGAPGVDKRWRQTTGRGPKAAAGRHRALQARVYQQHCPVSSHEPRRSLLLPTPSSPQLLNHTQPLPRAGRADQHAHTPLTTSRITAGHDEQGGHTRNYGACAAQSRPCRGAYSKLGSSCFATRW